MSEQPPAGRIVTFYSYKGGTGRSMALANVAWILASNGKRVMVIDWDLEAPGLHRYFHPFLRDKNFTSTEGLMDFIVDYASEALTPHEGPLPDDWYVAHADLGDFAESLRAESYFPKPGKIDFVSAGRQSELYAATVNRFNWQHFYDKLGGGAFFEAAKKHIRADYDYILIDSRTGVSDTSGICTIQMPDTVVICFTLNIQSLEGASAAAANIEAQRRAEGREVRILPVPTRVERNEKDKIELARGEAVDKFDRFLHGMTGEERTDYWSAVEIPYEAWYSFEEVLAPFGDRNRRQTSVLAAMESLTSYVSQGEVTRLQPLSEPERQHVLDLYLRRQAQTEVTADVATRGEEALARLSGAQQREALALILRLADFPANAPRVSTRAIPRKYLNVSDRVVQALEYAGVVKLERLEGGTEMVELIDAAVLQDWTRIRREIEADRPFLSWRQQFGDDAMFYDMSSDRDVLLSGARLKQAKTYLRERPDDFTECERDLIAASTRRRRAYGLAAAAAVLLPLLAFGGTELWRRSDTFQIRSVLDNAPTVVTRIASEADDRNNAIEKWIRALVGAGKVDEARGMVRSLHAGAGQAVAFGALASAAYEQGLGDLALQTKDAAEKTLGILPPFDRARAEIRIAEMLVARNQETALRLTKDAYETARDPNAIDNAAMVGRTSFGVEAAAAGRRRFELFSSIITLYEKLRLPNRAAQALAEANKKIFGVEPAIRAEWLLDLANTVDESFRDNDLAMTARRYALWALTSLPAGPGRFRALSSAAVALTEKNVDIAKCKLLLEFVRDATATEQYSVTARVVYTVPRWRLVGHDDAIWADAEQIALKLPNELKYDLLAQIAAGSAASGDTEAAAELVRRCRQALQQVEKTLGPAAGAELLAAISEAEKQLHSDDIGTRSQAVSLAFQERDVKRQARALMRIAVAAARSDAPIKEVEQTLDLVRDAEAKREKLPAIVTALADAAAVAKSAEQDERTQSAVWAAGSLGSGSERDAALKTIVDALVGAAKYAEAVAVARRIGSDDVQYVAFEEIKRSSDPMHGADIARRLVEPYRRASASLDVADRFQTAGKSSSALLTLHEAESDVASISDANKQSELFGRLAAAYANLHDLRNARRLADLCGDSSDRLLAFAAIVTNWSSAQQQRQPAKRAALDQKM